MANHPHRVASALAGVRAELAEVARVPLWSMDAAEATDAIGQVLAAEAQLAELKARLLTQAQTLDLAGRAGATSTATWVAHHTRTTRPAAHRDVRLATGLQAHDATRNALAAGRLRVEQAEVILRAIAELPDHLDAEQVVRAEAHLIEQAAVFDARSLRVLGRRILEVIDPEAAEVHQAQQLEREERDAAAAARLTIWSDGHGKTHGRFTLPAAQGEMLQKALLALAAPRHRASQGPLGERRPTPERLGRALCEYVARYPAAGLPQAGGLDATVVVTMTLDALLGGLGAAHLDTGQPVSAALARQLACEAKIIPAVLGGRSQVLDLGRSRRFHNKAQRIVATIEQGGCAVEGCDYPPAMTHLHHPVSWAEGGGTNRDAIMLCPPDHARAHDARYTMTRRPGQKIRFVRRT